MQMPNGFFPKGIIFDLDDTIIKFAAVSRESWITTKDSFNGTVFNDLPDLFEAIIQTRRWYWSDKDRHKKGRMDLSKARLEILEISFRKIGKKPNIPLIKSISDFYEAERESQIDFFPKAEETLIRLKKTGIKLLLLTNGHGEVQRKKIERFNLYRFFEDNVLIEGEVGVGKPEHKSYINAIKKINLKPKDLWFVGDNLEWDVYGPQKLGIYGIWNDYRKKGLPKNSINKPNRIINNISELLISDKSNSN